MGLPQYAETDDFERSPFSVDDDGNTIEVTDKTLTRASMKVRELLLTAEFDVDANGTPTDADVNDALKNATCAQAAWFAATGDMSGAGASEGPISLGPLSLGSNTNTAGGVEASRTSPEAVQILCAAGLIPGTVWHG